MNAKRPKIRPLILIKVFMFEKHIQYLPPRKQTAWRKIATGTWRDAGDPSIYAILKVDARPILRCMERYKNRGIKITPTHVMAKALSYAYEKYPRANSIQRFGRIYNRSSVDIFLQVAGDENGENLSGTVIKNCDQKSLQQVANELSSISQKIKKGDDENFNKVKDSMRFIPGFLMGYLLKFLGTILYTFNLWSKALGVPKDGFGSGMITSVGMMGVEIAFAPLVPWSHCPIILAIGKIVEEAVVENGNIIVCPTLSINGTLDHRIIDGVGGGKMIHAIKEYLCALDQLEI